MYLSLCWCCVPLCGGTQHSNQHIGMLAAAWVLPVRAAMGPWPCVREAAANASPGGLASGRALGEWRTHRMGSVKTEDFAVKR